MPMFKSEQNRLLNLPRLEMLGDPIPPSRLQRSRHVGVPGPFFSGRSAWSQMEKLSGYRHRQMVQPDEGVRVHSTGFGQQGCVRSYLRR